MPEQTATTAGTKTAETKAPTEKKVLDIARGRMPLAIVALIKFNESGATTAALATKYRTTVGKVSDIQKDRNFTYITKDFAPTEAMKNDAKAFVKGWAEEKVICEQIDKMKVATEEQAKAFDEIKKRSRPGRKAAETPAATPAATSGDVKAATPKARLMLSTSFLPQYWLMRIPSPLWMPKTMLIRRNTGTLAVVTAAISVLPS